MLSAGYVHAREIRSAPKHFGREQKKKKKITGPGPFILRRVFTLGVRFMTVFLRHQPQVIMGFPAERRDEVNEREGGREG